MRELLFSVTKNDFELTYFSGSGAGGQHRNKHQNCVRLRHPPSGVVTTGTRHKSRAQNTKDAFRAMVSHPTFKAWLNREVSFRLMDLSSVEDAVADMMAPENLKIEYYTPGG